MTYDVILADPPWKYGQKANTPDFRGGALKHYPLMPLNDIMNMKVAAYAADNCALFLWATMPLLQEALDVMSAWGFIYKTCAFTWIKTTKAGTPAVGLGHYTRANAELCLLGIKGRVKPMLQVNNVRSVVLAPRRKHSQKPEDVRHRIDTMFGDVKKLELFARQKVEGWDCWGNEVAQSIDMEF